MTAKFKVEGVIPAVITPFLPDFSLDLVSLREYVKHVADLDGVKGILSIGYSGETSSLTLDEKVRIVESCKEVLPEGLPLYGCVDAQSTSEAIEHGQRLKEAGADAIQINSPFVNYLRRGYLATPDASVDYFRAISDNVGLPMTIFQYPEWSGLSYSTDTLERLSEVPNVVGIKQAGSLDRYIQDFEVLSGRIAFIADNNGYSLLAMLLRGADATMVGASNVGTELYCQLFAATQAGDARAATELMNSKVLPLLNCFTRDLGHTQSSFAALMKEALVMQGLIRHATVRPPERPASEADLETVRRTISQVGLI